MHRLLEYFCIHLLHLLIFLCMTNLISRDNFIFKSIYDNFNITLVMFKILKRTIS